MLPQLAVRLAGPTARPGGLSFSWGIFQMPAIAARFLSFRPTVCRCLLLRLSRSTIRRKTAKQQANR